MWCSRFSDSGADYLMTALAINSEEANRIRIAEGRAPRFGPMLMLFARPTSILLAQGITYLLFLVIDVPNVVVVPACVVYPCDFDLG